MQNIHNITLTNVELSSLVEAYSTLQNFLEKILPPEDIYKNEFLTELHYSLDEIKNKDYVAVNTFDDFVN